MVLIYLKMKSSGKVTLFLFDQKHNQILNKQIASHNPQIPDPERV